MGCHTWTYKRFKSLSETEQRDTLVYANKRYNSITSEVKTLEAWKESERKSAEQYIKHYERFSDFNNANSWREWLTHSEERYNDLADKIKNFTGGITAENICAWAKAGIESSTTYKVINDELYCNWGVDIPFRVYGYPTDTFTTKASLIKWLKNNVNTNSNTVTYTVFKDNCDYDVYEVTKYTLPEFIKHLNKFFKKEGDDFYFKFG